MKGLVDIGRGAVATPTGEGITTPLTFTRERQFAIGGVLYQLASVDPAEAYRALIQHEGASEEDAQRLLAVVDDLR